MKHWYLYTLELESGKYYVGITTDVNRRYAQHCLALGAVYTKLFKPVNIFSVVELGLMTQDEAELYEDALTIEMIRRVGRSNCRGGHFVTNKHKNIDKVYKRLDTRYKKLQTNLPARQTLKRGKRVKKSPWSKMEAEAKRQLSISKRSLSLS